MTMLPLSLKYSREIWKKTVTKCKISCISLFPLQTIIYTLASCTWPLFRVIPSVPLVPYRFFT
jgi:hypothetical protein